MKKFILFAVFAIFIAGCSKKEVDPVEVDLGAQISGTYTASKYVENGIVYSLPDQSIGMSAGVKLTRISNTKATGLITITALGVTAEDGGDVDLKKSGDRIELYDGSTKVGYVEGSKIYIEEVDDDGTTYKIEASK